MYKVSIIIPTFKPGDYLWECLESIKSQSLPVEDFEVLLVLNGCEEPWKTDIENYIRKKGLDNFRFFHTNEKGVSNARNIALDAVQGEFITFIDDDDFISPTYIEELYSKATTQIISLCYPLSFKDGTRQFESFYITKDYYKNYELQNCSYTRAKRFFAGPVYKMIHKDIIGNNRFDKSFKNGEDTLFMFKISDKFRQVSFTSKNAVYYRRIRNGSALLTKKSRKEIINNFIRLLGGYTNIFFQKPLEYNMGFYFTRLLGALHGCIEQFVNRRNRNE